MTSINDTILSSVALNDQPAQALSDAFISEGLSIAEIADLGVRPDRDALVFKEADDTYSVIDMPATTALAGLQPGAAVATPASSGTFFRYIDNPGTRAGAVFYGDVTIGGKTSPAVIRRIPSFDNGSPGEPFSDRLVVESGGARYQIDLGNEFEDFAAGDTVTVSYASHAGSEASHFPANVVSFNDTAKKQKYPLARPVEASIVNERGMELPVDDPVRKEIAAVLAESRILKEGEKYSRNELRRRFKRLGSALGQCAFLATPGIAWATPGESIAIRLKVVAPIAGFALSLAPSAETPPEWIAGVDAESVDALGRGLQEILNAHTPLSADSWKKALGEIKKFSRNDPDWEVEDVQIGTGAQGEARVACVIAPKAKYLSATVDGKSITSNDLKMPWELPDTIPAKKLKNSGKDFFTSLSALYAVLGKTLVLSREGSLQPLIPEYRKVGDAWELAVPEGAEIVSVQAPRFVNFTPPTDGRGKPVGPRSEEWLGLFHDTEFPGVYTTTAISEGLKKLTHWYDERGYRFTHGHLECEMGDGVTLNVKAELIRFAEDVILIPEADEVEKDKKKKHLKFITREFRFHAGEFLNANDMAAAIAGVRARFHVIATPYFETDEAEGTVKVTVRLADDGISPLDNVTLGGGYSGTSGAYAQASGGYTSYNGYRTSASAAYYPQADLGGASVSLTTPRDADGATNEASVSGQYYLNYISSVGVNYNHVIPIGDSRWSLIAGGGAQALFSSGGSIDGTDALYFGPNIGLSYYENGLSARLVAGPRVSTEGAFYVGLEGGVSKRYDLNEAETLYLELYAKGGALIGVVPVAAQFHSAPIALHGYYVQPPLEAKLYAVAGANLMQELPGGFLDVGIGASAGIIGAVWVIGGGIKIRLKVLFPMTVTIGPALVDGVPTLLTVSLGP